MTFTKLFQDTKAALLVFAVIFGSYLIFSPNYRWSVEFEETPYAADFLQEWVGARMIVSGQAHQLYSEQFLHNQHDPDYVGFAWNLRSIFHPFIHLLITCFLVPWDWCLIGGRESFGCYVSFYSLTALGFRSEHY